MNDFDLKILDSYRHFGDDLGIIPSAVDIYNDLDAHYDLQLYDSDLEADLEYITFICCKYKLELNTY